MSCDLCKDIEERKDVPHLIKKCESCGRELHFVRHAKHGKGIKPEEGEKFVIPKGWLKISFNPLKSRGQLYRPGMNWFAQMVFVDGLLGKEEEYINIAEELEDEMLKIVNESPLIKPLDLNNEDDAEQILEIIKKNPHNKEYWAFFTAFTLSIAREARLAENAERSSWASACAERCRSMLIFKEHLEEVVFMGHSAKRIIDVLNIWSSRSKEDSEDFWQETFKDHSYVLSQVFAVPVVFIEEKAYVGGMKIDRQEGKFVDYLLSAESSREAMLVEIKTPITKLLGQRYRNNVYAPSAELSGAISQLLSYKNSLMKSYREIFTESHDIQAFRPRCVLIAGNASEELSDNYRRESFELFRSSLDIEIITYDELFRKVEILAELFALKRSGE